VRYASIFLPNVAMSRVYGWRGGCSAADVPDGDVGSVEWFGMLSRWPVFEQIVNSERTFCPADMEDKNLFFFGAIIHPTR